MMAVFLAILAFYFIVAFFGYFVLPFLYIYKIGERHIQIAIFGAPPVFTVAFEEIDEVRAPTWRELLPDFSTLRAGNRLLGKTVLVTKRRGFIRRVIITPADPQAFIDTVNAGKLALGAREA